MGICSCVAAKGKRDAIRETWMQHQEKGIECKFFVGGGVPMEEEKEDIVVLNSPDGYHELPEKIRDFLKYALENYNFDWLFKCDDDTYLRLDRLAEIADRRYDLIGDALVERRLSPGGGSGYFLSRKIVEKIVNVPDFQLWGAEDVIIGELVCKLGGKLLSSYRLFINNTCYPRADNDMISAHWCSPELLRGIHFMTHNQPASLYMGKHAGWSDVVQFFSNGFFRRTTSNCYGQWSLGTNEELFLKWQMWSQEQCLDFDDLYVGSTTTLRRFDTHPSLAELAKKNPLLREAPTDSDHGLNIHLGARDHFLPGWLNLDMPHFDIGKKLPWPDETVNAFFLENTLEQVPFADSVRFFKEAFRELVPGGILRICFTDFLRFSQEITPLDRQKIRENTLTPQLPDNGIELLGDWLGYKSFFTLDIVTHLLKEAGFTVTESPVGESSHPHLQQLEKTQSDENFRLELIGRVSLEAQKPKTKSRQRRKAKYEEEISYVTPRFRPEHRTGNKLFQIAAVYAHSLRLGLECRVPWLHSQESRQLYQSLGAAKDYCPEGGYEDDTTYQEPKFSYTPIPDKIRFGALDGFFQSEKYFSDTEKEIRSLYKNLTRPRREGIAGVHIRMGDYLNRTDMYHSPDKNFLETALRCLSDNVSELMIFSDSPYKAIELVHATPSSKKFSLSINTDNTIDAMRSLSSMQELILSCSSFSWWPAYLGDQEKVFIQRRWFTGVIKDDYDVYRKKWIRL